jgi:hypothetical protein|tara:strand:+ start:10198 stop:10422 length:225 start_codon:yes stop_codon:yes gene_type:complete
MKTKRKEARLLSYTLLYDKSGKLVTERVSTDVEKLKPFFTDEEFYTLKTTLRKATTELDKIHNQIEADLHCRIQ